MAKTLKIKAMNNKSGKRKNLNLAILDSKIATIDANAKTFNKNIPIAKRIAKKFISAANPQGKNKLTPSVKKIKNLLADAHSITANLFPEYSKIIASWTIVSSRCVAGLSNGKCAVSESSIMTKDTKAKITGVKSSKDNEETEFAIENKFVE